MINDTQQKLSYNQTRNIHKKKNNFNSILFMQINTLFSFICDVNDC